MSKNWIFLVLGVVVLVGICCGIGSLVSQHDLFGTNNEVNWGLLIAAYAFLVSSIGCCFVGSLGSVFGIKKYEPIEKEAIFLAGIIVLLGMAVIFVELGQPFRIFAGYIANPNPTSPIWWMGGIYILYLIFIVLEFIFLIRKNLKLAQFVGIFAFLSAVVAHSTVGSVFGVTQARPFWYGPYMPIDFILCAWILGFSLMITVLFLTKDRIASQPLITDMGKWLAVFLGINLFFIFWKVTTGLYSGEGGKYLATLALFKGPLSVRFWGGEIIAGLILPFVLIIGASRRGNVFAAAIFSIIGMFVNKMNMVEAGQIVPLEIRRTEIVTYLKYSPTFVEICIVAGAIAFVLLSYGLVERFYFAKTKEGG